jgi:hypothetical protein
MSFLLKAFPDTLYIGMTAAVGFAKSSNAHMCAFDVPLNRILLESDAPNGVPAPVVAVLGRSAFCHSGLVPFAADAVAQHKGEMVSAVDVARAACENTVRLYGHGIETAQAERVKEMKILIAVREKELQRLGELEVQSKEAVAVDEANTAEQREDEESGGNKKKKKKKKKGKHGNGDDEGEGGGAALKDDGENFDEDAHLLEII